MMSSSFENIDHLLVDKKLLHKLVRPSDGQQLLRKGWVCSAVLTKGRLHASPILLDSQVRNACGYIRKHSHFARICG